MLITNTARTTNWMVSFNAKIPGNYSVDVTDWIQSISIPDVSVSPATTNYKGPAYKVYGETPEHGSLTVTYLLDENWELLTILYGSLYQSTRNSEPLTVFSDMTLFGLDTYSKPKFKLELGKVVLTNISGFDLDTSADDSPIIITATYEYSIHQFRKISTAGRYGIGSGPYTMGMFMSDGTPTSSNFMNDAKYRKYYGKLFSAGVLTNEQMKTSGLPQPIKLSCRPPIVMAETDSGAITLKDKTGAIVLGAPRPTEAPTGTPTEAPTTPVTEAPTGTPTEAPTTPVTEAPTGTPTEAPTTPVTEAPTSEPIPVQPVYMMGNWVVVEPDEPGAYALLNTDEVPIVDASNNQIFVVYDIGKDPTGGVLVDSDGNTIMSNGLWSLTLLENEYYSIFGNGSKIGEFTKICGVYS